MAILRLSAAGRRRRARTSVRRGRFSAALPAGLLLLALASPWPAAGQSGRPDSTLRSAERAVRAGQASAHDSTLRSAERAARGGQVAASDSALRSAERAARVWLWLLDEARYDSAWSVVAPAMRSVVGYREWTTSLTRLRSALPFPLRRERLKAEHSVPLFGGSSVILSFGVGRGSMREIVVLVRTRERWLVGGYGILLQ